MTDQVRSARVLPRVKTRVRGGGLRGFQIGSTPMPSRTRSPLFATAVAALSSACVLWVTPDTPGEHCAFKGESACAACIRTSCQKPIDQCCLDNKNYSGCGYTDSYLTATDNMMTDIDLCGQGGDPAQCHYAIQNASADGVTGVLAACVRDSCGTECFGDGKFHTSCELKNGGTVCTCSPARTSKGGECSASVVGSGCVQTGSYCACGVAACTSDCLPRATDLVCCIGTRYSNSAELECTCSNRTGCGSQRVRTQDCYASSIQAALETVGNRVERCDN
jgi:hypothetical protein